MKTILKPIFDWVVDQYSLFDNPLYNWIAAAIIGMIGLGVAWFVVGKLYDNDNISGRVSGSIIHWVVRLFVVSCLYVLVAAIIWIVKLVVAAPWWSWLIAVGLIVTIGIIGIIIKCRSWR